MKLLFGGNPKLKRDMKKHGKALTSLNYYFSTLSRQFYPLAYMKNAIMDWKTLGKVKDKVCKAILKSLGEEH